jgi:integrase
VAEPQLVLAILGYAISTYAEHVTPSHHDADVRFVGLWLHGRPPTTQQAYAADIERFLAFVAKPLAAVTLGDLQAYADQLGHLAPATQARRLTAVKSLLVFGHRLGHLTFDVGRVLRSPSVRNRRAERIQSEAAVQDLRVLKPNRRKRVLLGLLYASGVRVSALCGLTWAAVQERDDAGQITVEGKGGRARAVLLLPAMWSELIALREGAPLPATSTPGRRQAIPWRSLLGPEGLEGARQQVMLERWGRLSGMRAPELARLNQRHD